MEDTTACVALGSNLGEPAATLRKAAGRMDGILPGVRLAACSRLWMTAPLELERMPRVLLPEVLRIPGEEGGSASLLPSSIHSHGAPLSKPSPWYANMVVRLECGPGISPEGLFDALMRLEAELGRNRLMERRWGPRLIDIDLLNFGDAERNTPRLMLPHPRMFERAFVVLPLAEVAPELIVPEIFQRLSFVSSGTMLF